MFNKIKNILSVFRKKNNSIYNIKIEDIVPKDMPIEFAVHSLNLGRGIIQDNAAKRKHQMTMLGIKCTDKELSIILEDVTRDYLRELWNFADEHGFKENIQGRRE